MRDYSFNYWLSEFADYGMDKTKEIKDKVDDGDKPLMPLNIEYVVKYFKNKTLGNKPTTYNNFFGEVQWGHEAGAVKLSFNPFGGMRATLRKLTHDMQGEPVWICKKAVEVNNLYDDHPDNLTYKLEEMLIEMDQENIDGPIHDFQELERIVIQLASVLRRSTTQRIFIYEGIRRIEEKYKYLIHFGLSGLGLQARGQKRVDQFAVHVEYSQDTGLIKITGTPLGDKIDKHRWLYDTSTFVEYFSPTQNENEILSSVLVCFNTY
jgi:hypothetical protein